MIRLPERQKKVSLRTTLTLSYVLVILTALGLFAWRSYTTTERSMVKMAQDNVHQLIQTKNQILDLSFRGVRDATLNLLVDTELYELVSELDFDDEVMLIEADRDIKLLLQKYFNSYQQVESVALVTEHRTFGYWNNDITFDHELFDTDIYHMAVERQGASFYLPTYNYSKLTGHKAEWQASQPQDMVFSLVRMTNLTYISKQYTAERLHRFQRNPVLVISYSDDSYRNELQGLSLPAGSQYMVLAADGTVVSHSDWQLLGTRYTGGWATSLLSSRSGVDYRKVDEQDTIVCFDTSDETGWTTIVTIPRSSLLSDVLQEIRGDLLLFTAVALGLAVLLSMMLTSKFTNSIDQVLQTIQKVEDGDFDVTAKYTNIPEFDYMVDRFNAMSSQIKRLIEENYLTTIRQRESEIAILTTQLNPHFLYNTLNVIQLANLNGQNQKTGEMIVALSRMLNYTADNRQEMKPLREDLAWLNQYIYIMKCRYADEFSIETTIDDEMMELPVPKLFLQPILENSILHAFKHRDLDGVINIRGWLADEQLLFVVEDNGDGMSHEQVEMFLASRNMTIGINNVYQRLKLIYGSSVDFEITSELGKGTRTTIKIPLNRQG